MEEMILNPELQKKRQVIEEKGDLIDRLCDEREKLKKQSAESEQRVQILKAKKQEQDGKLEDLQKDSKARSDLAASVQSAREHLARAKTLAGFFPVGWNQKDDGGGSINLQVGNILLKLEWNPAGTFTGLPKYEFPKIQPKSLASRQEKTICEKLLEIAKLQIDKTANLYSRSDIQELIPRINFYLGRVSDVMRDLQDVRDRGFTSITVVPLKLYQHQHKSSDVPDPVQIWVSVSNEMKEQLVVRLALGLDSLLGDLLPSGLAPADCISLVNVPQHVSVEKVHSVLSKTTGYGRLPKICDELKALLGNSKRAKF